MEEPPTPSFLLLYPNEPSACLHANASLSSHRALLAPGVKIANYNLVQGRWMRVRTLMVKSINWTRYRLTVSRFTLKSVISKFNKKKIKLSLVETYFNKLISIFQHYNYGFSWTRIFYKWNIRKFSEKNTLKFLTAKTNLPHLGDHYALDGLGHCFYTCSSRNSEKKSFPELGICILAIPSAMSLGTNINKQIKRKPE